MLQPYNRCYPSYGISPPYGVVMGHQQQPSQQQQQQKAYHGSNETRKAIDHYSYAVNEEIGRGFSSKVYRGRDENNSQPVAVKVIDMKMVKQSIHALLLKNEISALKSFNSKNILKLFDVFQTQNNTYLITEFCDSGDLSARIKRRGRLEEGEAVKIMKEVVSGLNEINQKGRISDIKPANILMEGGTPKIADFGFAVQINSNDAKSQSKHFNVGTPLYMSPQALRQQGHNEKGDVWAIGVMFFEMLFGNLFVFYEPNFKGRPPFQAQSEAALLSNILHQGLQIPTSPPLSDLCKDFLRKCLQVDEGRRIKVKDMAQHALVVQERIMKLPSTIEPVQERVPLRTINPNVPNLSNVPNGQKEKRSHSQGVRDYNSRPIKSENVLQKKNENTRLPQNNIFYERGQNKRSPTDVSNMNIDQRDLVGRSKSQKHILDVKGIKAYTNKVSVQEAPSPTQNFKRQQSFEQPPTDDPGRRGFKRTATFVEQHQPSQQEFKSQPAQSPGKFKGNNDILFSQINFCRFLYKFSQQMTSSSKMQHFKLQPNLREKLLFLIAKNIVIKIQKLSLLNEKENCKDNLFQLEDFENYRRSDSFLKFSQAIWEYNEKYKKYFEKMYSMTLRQSKNIFFNNITKDSPSDKKFETLVDKDFSEFESFYLISQSYVKQALMETNQEVIKFQERPEYENSPDYHFCVWLLENLIIYSNLINSVQECMNDYRRFLKNVQMEKYVDRKPKKMTLQEVQDLIQQATAIINK